MKKQQAAQQKAVQPQQGQAAAQPKVSLPPLPRTTCLTPLVPQGGHKDGWLA